MMTQQENKIYATILKKGLEQIGMGQYHRAIETFEQAIQMNEKSWIGHQGIALCRSMIFLIQSHKCKESLDSIISELELSLKLSIELKRNIS